MSNSPNLTLPYLSPAQAQKHVTHNEALKVLDAVVQLSVLDRDLAAPPGTPAEGNRYIVGGSATGEWSGEDNHIAAFQDGAWTFYNAEIGWLAWVADESALVVWDGASWVSAGGSLNPASLVGVNATADNTNRLTVSSPATLFNHEGSDHRVKVNKASGTDSASVLFQTGFSGRAEFGLTGDDNFHMKVSPDGASFKDGIILHNVTGEMGTPFSIAGRPNLLVNGDFQINAREFAGGALGAGVYGHDRWKAGGGGANYSMSGFDVTLASGELSQVVEAALWGYDNFDAHYVTASIESPTADLTVSFGSSTGTISSGSGRQSYSFAPGSGTSGTPTFSISSALGGSVQFSHIRLEVSAFPSQWWARPIAEELALAARYYRKIKKVNGGSDIRILSPGSVYSGGFEGTLFLPEPMLGPPVLSHSALSTFQIAIAGGASSTPTSIVLSDDDNANLAGSQYLSLSVSHGGIASGGGYLSAASGQTAEIGLDAEL